MARFSCSYVTNITTFQEPRRRKEGKNLERSTKTLAGFDIEVKLIVIHTLSHSPLIKGTWSLFGQHRCSTVEDAAVLAWTGVHVSGLDHVDWRGDDGGAQSCPEG